jgi:hypothetical protein
MLTDTHAKGKGVHVRFVHLCHCLRRVRPTKLSSLEDEKCALAEVSIPRRLWDGIDLRILEPAVEFVDPDHSLRQAPNPRSSGRSSMRKRQAGSDPAA